MEYKYCIYTLGNQFESSLAEIFDIPENKKLLIDQFNNLEQELSKNGVEYKELRHALEPPVKKKHDMMFIFDSDGVCKKFHTYLYGEPIFKELFDLLRIRFFKGSKNSIFSGDLLDLMSNEGLGPILKKYIQKNLHREIAYGDYYIILLSNLSEIQYKHLDNGFHSAFNNTYNGMVDITDQDIIQSDFLLPAFGIKCGNTVIMPAPDDEYLSLYHSMISKNYKIVYIDENLYTVFLTYNYCSYNYLTVKDLMTLLNHGKDFDINSFQIIIDPRKIDEYLVNQKPQVIEAVKKILHKSQDSNLSVDELKKALIRKSNYIFNIRVIDDNQFMFNVYLNDKQARINFAFLCNMNKQTICLVTAI